jgi:hypothetical protein
MPNYDRLYALDEPVPYKNIKLFPVKVRDHDMFYRCISCLTLEKNSIPDIRIIKMSYLEYLYHLHIENKEVDYLLLLDYLLKLCIQDDDMGVNYYFDNTNKPVFEIGKKVLDANGDTILDNDRVRLSDKEIFNANDFEEIRMIICNQNLVELVDETIQKDVRDKMDEARMLKAKASGNKPASFEDTMLCLVASTNLSLEQVYDLPLSKFIKLLQRVDAKLHYQIYMTAAMSGMVEFKDKSILRHWMSDLEKDNKNSDVMLDFDKVKEKVSPKT